MPFDIENGNDKINALINKYKGATNAFHSERKPDVKGVTLNCLRLYHSDELNQLAPQLIIGNPDRTGFRIIHNSIRLHILSFRSGECKTVK